MKGKRYKNIKTSFGDKSSYNIEDAVSLIKGSQKVKFDETIDIAVNLGVDPKHSDQIVKGVVKLPNGTGKDIKIAVFAKDEKAQEASKAGADFVGEEDLALKIEKNEIDVDRVIATPDMMGIVGKLGKVLGPKGLMPNPKMGTVSDNLADSVNRIKNKSIEIKNDKDGNLSFSIGRKNFEENKILENIKNVFENLKKEKPTVFNAENIKKVYLSSTMGNSFKLNFKDI